MIDIRTLSIATLLDTAGEWENVSTFNSGTTFAESGDLHMMAADLTQDVRVWMDGRPERTVCFSLCEEDFAYFIDNLPLKRAA